MEENGENLGMKPCNWTQLTLSSVMGKEGLKPSATADLRNPEKSKEEDFPWRPESNVALTTPWF